MVTQLAISDNNHNRNKYRPEILRRVSTGATYLKRKIFIRRSRVSQGHGAL